MENQENKMQIVEISSTCKAVLISPKLTNEMALVDLTILQRITSMLSLANLQEIKENFIREVKATESLEDYNETLKKEFLFHETVNLIRTITL